jgi:hypothetical protein
MIGSNPINSYLVSSLSSNSSTSIGLEAGATGAAGWCLEDPAGRGPKKKRKKEEQEEPELLYTLHIIHHLLIIIILIILNILPSFLFSCYFFWCGSLFLLCVRTLSSSSYSLLPCFQSVLVEILNSSVLI